MSAFFSSQPRLRGRHLYRMHPKVLAHCANYSYLDMIRDVVRAAAAGANYTGHPSPLLTGCGFGATFDINFYPTAHGTEPPTASDANAHGVNPSDTPGPSFHFAFVRHPLPRFISALCPHVSHLNSHSCRKHIAVERFIGEAPPPRLSVVEALAFRARLMRFQARFSDEAHVRTQTFYLSSTDAAGRPVPWHAIFKIDGPSFPRQLSQLMTSVLLDAGASAAEAEATAARQDGVKRNSKARDAEWYGLLAEVEAHPTLLCDVCHVYARDFVCLGYELPSKCTEPQCLAGMPEWLLNAAVAANSTAAANAAAVQATAASPEGRVDTAGARK
jgi:hypothetical protein